jgi:hypothetical protein
VKLTAMEQRALERKRRREQLRQVRGAHGWGMPWLYTPSLANCDQPRAGAEPPLSALRRPQGRGDRRARGGGAHGGGARPPGARPRRESLRDLPRAHTALPSASLPCRELA